MMPDIIYFGDVRLPSGQRARRFPRLRRKLQNWLGIEDTSAEEQIQDAKLSRVDKAATYAQRRCEHLTRELTALQADFALYRKSTSATHRRIQTDLDNLVEVTGGLWRTASGHLLMIRQMSDNHLQNVLEYKGASEATKHLVRVEQRRRLEDDQWHNRYGKVSPRKLLERVSNVLRMAQMRIETLEARIRQPLAPKPKPAVRKPKASTKRRKSK